MQLKGKCGLVYPIYKAVSKGVHGSHKDMQYVVVVYEWHVCLCHYAHLGQVCWDALRDKWSTRGSMHGHYGP